MMRRERFPIANIYVPVKRRATLKPQTEVPAFGIDRSSGSRVRLPVMTTRLMFVAATVTPFLVELTV